MLKLKQLLVALVGTGALVAVVPALGLAGAPIVNDHIRVVDGPFDTEFCGVPGTGIDTVVEEFRQDAGGSFIDNVRVTTLFTATASGKSLEASESAVDKVNVTDNGDGTVTFVEHNAGLVLHFKIVNGPVLKAASGEPLRSAGVIDSAATFDVASGDLIAITESFHGPHLFREGVDVCGPTIAYLTS
jgi:hypothetical protein